jgi:hypothetical protein
MGILRTIGAGIGSMWATVVRLTTRAMITLKTSLSTVVAKASGVPVVGTVVKVAAAGVAKTTAMIAVAGKTLTRVFNANPVLSGIAMALPMTWRLGGLVLDTAANAVGWVADKVSAGATWFRETVSNTLGRIPGVGGTAQRVWDTVTGTVGRGVGRVADFVSSSVRNVAGSMRHWRTSRIAAVTYLAVTGLQFGLSLVGVGLGFFGTPAFAVILAAGSALGAYPAAVWLDYKAEEMQRDALRQPDAGVQGGTVAQATVEVKAAKATGTKVTDNVVEFEAEIPSAEVDDENPTDEDIAVLEGELVRWKLPLAPKDNGKRQLWVFDGSIVDPAQIRWERRVAYIADIPVGVDMQPVSGTRKLNPGEHGKRLRSFWKAVHAAEVRQSQMTGATA